LENEGGVISSLDQQAIPAFERRWRSGHDSIRSFASLPQWPQVVHRLSPTNHGGFNQPSCFSVMPTVVSPLAEEG
jgi:hypothetical protein